MYEDIRNLLRTNQTEIYYYLSLDTFINHVIQNKKLEILFSHIDYLEDEQEFQQGIDDLNSIPGIDQSVTMNLQSFKKIWPFQLSLSTAKDCYPMWKIYAKGDLGIMLIFDVNKLKEEFSNIFPCLYTESEEYKRVRQFLYESITSNDLGVVNDHSHDDILRLFPYLAKNKAYDYEKEVRIIMGVRDHEKTVFLTRDNVLKQYKKVEFTCEALKQIMVGPCRPEQYAKTARSLLTLCAKNNFSHIKSKDILPSNIPVRY